MGNESVIDYDTDMQTIRDYVSALTETRSKVAFAYCAALDQLQLVFQAPAPSDTAPHIADTMLKAGIKLIEKTAVDAVKGSTGADLGPVVEVLHGMLEEVERASKAAAGAAAAGWILDLRGTIVDAYTRGQSGEDLRRRIEEEYNRNDEGGRGGYIAGIQNELDALRQAQDLIPASDAIERAMYEAWINGHFDNDCMEGTGLIELVFDQDGSAASARVVCPLGEQVGARLNSIMADAGVENLMGLDVVKRVCRDDQCMCFEGDNVVRADVLDEDVNSFLSAPDNWRAFVRFTG